MAIGATPTVTSLKVGSVTAVGPDGKPLKLQLNGQATDSAGNLLLTSTGKAIFYDPTKKMLVDSSGKAVAVDKKGKIAGKTSVATPGTTSVSNAFGGAATS